MIHDKRTSVEFSGAMELSQIKEIRLQTQWLIQRNGYIYLSRKLVCFIFILQFLTVICPIAVSLKRLLANRKDHDKTAPTGAV